MSSSKGTVTPLNSYFSPDETQKAAQRVEDAISGRRNEFQRLQSFLSDNSNLINLVRSIPDELSHDIMVPFGGAAFFPGRLIHTNEFLVLLGDGYYAERSSKQTIDILKRREKTLEDQMEVMKATMKDLEAEATFFKSTAAEASEGIVEIREEYMEDLHQSSQISGDSEFDTSASNGDNLQMPDKDEELEHARILKILKQLELKEEDYESVSSDEDENNLVTVDGDGDAVIATSYSTHDTEGNVSQKNTKHLREHDYFGSADFEKSESSSGQHLVDQSCVLESGKHFRTEASKSDKNQLDIKEKVPLMYSDVKNCENFSSSTSSEGFGMHPDARKAFTGSIVEHDHGLQPMESSKSIATGKSSATNPSRPVSRFKMQRSNH